MIGNAKRIINWLLEQKEDTIYDIKEFKEKRSKTQNSYYWVLLSKLAGVLETSKEELHETMIRRYSNRDYVSFLSSVDVNRYFKYYDKIGTFKEHGNTFNSYIVYQESHLMNKAEFKTLLDGLISECKECNIETLTPEELEELKFIENDRRNKR